jgi:hypothetical protein
LPRRKKTATGSQAVDKRYYQECYRQLFTLVMLRESGELEQPESVELRRRMDVVPGTNDEKRFWGIEVGRELYGIAVYGRVIDAFL